MAANLTTTYASQILDLLGLSKFKGGGQCPPPAPPDKNIPDLDMPIYLPSVDGIDPERRVEIDYKCLILLDRQSNRVAVHQE